MCSKEIEGAGVRTIADDLAPDINKGLHCGDLDLFDLADELCPGLVLDLFDLADELCSGLDLFDLAGELCCGDLDVVDLLILVESLSASLEIFVYPIPRVVY